jgi:hypothetical protein
MPILNLNNGEFTARKTVFSGGQKASQTYKMPSQKKISGDFSGGHRAVA